MTKKKAAPKCGPSLSGPARLLVNDSTSNPDNASVTYYRTTEDAIAEYGGFILQSEIEELYLTGNRGLPSLLSLDIRNRKALKKEMRQACKGMADGRIVDIQFYIMFENAISISGVHRAPLFADQDHESIFLIGISRHGNVSSMRLQPSTQAMQRYAAAFGMGSNHVH